MSSSGLSSFNVSARAMAAIVDVISPVPIIITHPTMAGALDMNGNTSITIIGWPTEKHRNQLQRYKSGWGSIRWAKFRKRGPVEGWSNGTGADFATFGGPPANPGNVSLGSTGHIWTPLLRSRIRWPEWLRRRYRRQTEPRQRARSTHCIERPATALAGSRERTATCTEYTPGALLASGISGHLGPPCLTQESITLATGVLHEK